ELEPIDPVLDILDDLGFFLRGDRISDKVLHHFFYYWIRGYWMASEPYVRAWRTRPKERTRWGNIEKLFEATREVEISNGGKREEEELNDPREVEKFLREEIDSTKRTKKPKEPKQTEAP